MDDDQVNTISSGANLPDLQSWNLEDLEAYIVKLAAEIKRVERKIEEKKAVGSAAASLFKS